MSRDKPGEFPDELENTAAAWVFRRESGMTPEEEAELNRWRANALEISVSTGEGPNRGSFV